MTRTTSSTTRHSGLSQDTETRTRVGPLGRNTQGLPDQAAIDMLYEERDFQRACQIYIWALPIVSYAQWQNQHETVFGAQDGDIVKYLSVRDKLGLITVNATTPYVMGFTNTVRTGPLVIDSPAGEIAGGVGDFWERSLSDIGVTGLDKGKGGRYLVLGPSQEAPAGLKVDYEVRSPTFNTFHAFRILTTDKAEAERIQNGYQVYLATNADGSVDLVFAPEPPGGSPESNWIPTTPGRAWFTYFRLYAPLEPYFDASWKLPDIEAIESQLLIEDQS